MDFKKIRENGWLQGAAFDSQTNAAVSDHLPAGVDIRPEDCLIIVSHSCDVLNNSEEKEPTAEICIAKPCTMDGGKLHGKNSRFLQIQVNNGQDASYFEIHAKDRYPIPRKLLVTTIADRVRYLDSLTIETLRAWLAGRYIRAAFPDTFNDRIKNALIRVRRKARQVSNIASAIFLVVEPPEDELKDGEVYTVNLFGAIPDEVFEKEPTSRKAINEFLSDVAAELKACDGIIVEEFDARLESEITLQDLRYLRKLDFDDLSFKNDEPRSP